MSRSRIPNDFWDPVKITISNKELIFYYKCFECPICGEKRRKALESKCCDGLICKSCSISWFTKNDVHCPFCRKDIRLCNHAYVDEDNTQNLIDSHPLR